MLRISAAVEEFEANDALSGDDNLRQFMRSEDFAAPFPQAVFPRLDEIRMHVSCQNPVHGNACGNPIIEHLLHRHGRDPIAWDRYELEQEILVLPRYGLSAVEP